MSSTSGMIEWLHRECSARKKNKTYGCDNFGCVYCRAARVINAMTADMSRLAATVRRDALEEAAKVCETLTGSDTTPTLRPGARMCLHRIRSLAALQPQDAPTAKDTEPHG